MEYTPKPRWHKGEHLRSGLEADWVDGLDLLGMDWEYEPEVFRLPSGRFYQPDFHLRKIGTWLEVKGETVPGLEKAHEFAAFLRERDSPGWPGGEILVIGRSVFPRFRWGPLNTWLVKCPECSAYSWVTSRFLACRACTADLHRPCTLMSSGDLEAVDRLCRGSR